MDSSEIKVGSISQANSHRLQSSLVCEDCYRLGCEPFSDANKYIVTEIEESGVFLHYYVVDDGGHNTYILQAELDTAFRIVYD